MKKLLAPISALFYYLFAVAPAFAATTINICPLDETGQPDKDFGILCRINGAEFGTIIGTAITFVFIISVIIALGFLIWGGIRWILSGGDKGGVETARNTIVAAIVGLVVIFLSFFILQVVIGFFIPGFSLTNIVLPSLKIN